ncbi:ATP-binding cassette subfamily C protein CydC [Agromyces sp. 3263]|uniref:thiol reductant ABC exporter subunit CydC n=1 Tax=Agromyces sp. 3263 TaxID=2817750 RepID=UPI0028600BCB|nr:thiol reductant ABC exporter subunit CydC [Agromyces sp. 3263]MDR6907068.1 ATP-binding cassette subfamily C protein CydC [Agromyces sp. 3263]
MRDAASDLHPAAIGRGSSSDTAAATRAMLRRAVPPPRRLLPAILLGIASAASSVALLACSAWLIARAAEQPPVLYLSLGIVGVRAFALGRAAFRYLERLTGHDASFRQLASIRAGIFERMLPLAPDALASSRRGDLLARFVDDVDELQNVPLRVVQPLVSALVVLAVAVAGIAFLAPASALAVLGCLVAGIGTTLLVQRGGARLAERDLAPLRGELQAAVVEHVRALDVLIAFDAAGAGRRRIEQLGERLARATRARAAATGAASAAMSAVGGIAVAASLVAAAPLLEGGRIDGPTFAVLCLVPLAIAEVAGAVPLAVTARRLSRASAERVAHAVPATVPPEVPAPPLHPLAAPEMSPPAIELRGLRAGWPAVEERSGPGDEPAAASAGAAALDGLDLTIAPGERLLVRGASGAGKTTLAHVLVRFLAYRGSYRIGGVEASELEPAGVRRLVGLVEQRPWLFDEDVRQNLLFARDTATDDDLLDVLDRVGLREWLDERGGLGARVGERGALVSGGQAQRLALARAMLADFPILVLDEPTASVDPARADALLRDLTDAAGRSGRTVVVISHGAVDERLVDRTIELCDGRAIETSRGPGPLVANSGGAAREP